MTLNRIAGVATIIAVIVTVIQFVAGNEIVQVDPKGEATELIIKKEKANVQLTLDLPEYSSTQNWLLAMYEAAISMPYASSKSDALMKVIDQSLKVEDYNMALIASLDMPYASTKAEGLGKVVSAAIVSKETIAYAVVAADKMPYASSKREALDKVVNAYASFSDEPNLVSHSVGQ
ncbi:TPA: hypothetical protein ACGUS9_004318, partial [Vibrio vulnificus]|nr:hypothetical protein [Vibrio vulnificus]